MDTIAAISTPPGPGGIGIIRISGPDAKNLLGKVFLFRNPRTINFIPWRLHHGVVLDENGNILDDVLGVYMPGPQTYTGEDSAEIHCHGNPVILEGLLKHLLSLGARFAEPGEFTKRAFLNGQMDLSQAEAVAELVGAPTRQALRYSFERLEGGLSRKVHNLLEQIEIARRLVTVALDFPEEEIIIDVREVHDAVSRTLDEIKDLLTHTEESRLYQSGARLVLAGPANVGKSSLLNAISGVDRALVTSFPGTTRDFLEMRMNFSGLPVCLVDTAGLRETAEEVEALGIKKSLEQFEEADLILFILDSSKPDEKAAKDAYTKFGPKLVLIWNKIDLRTPELNWEWSKAVPAFQISCLTGENISNLRLALHDLLITKTWDKSCTEYISPNQRQAEKLRHGAEELEAMLNGFKNDIPLDCLASHLDAASFALKEILGLQSSEEVLKSIFSSFCIGK